MDVGSGRRNKSYREMLTLKLVPRPKNKNVIGTNRSSKGTRAT